MKRVRMLVNLASNDRNLSKGDVVDCDDPRVDDWLAAGFCVTAVMPDAQKSALVAQTAPMPSPAPEPHMSEPEKREARTAAPVPVVPRRGRH